jgi:hypothetical protein
VLKSAQADELEVPLEVRKRITPTLASPDLCLERNHIVELRHRARSVPISRIQLKRLKHLDK